FLSAELQRLAIRCFANMLSPDHAGIASAGAKEAQNVKPHSLFCANRPSLLIGGDIRFRPRDKTRPFLALWISHAGRRINLDVPRKTPRIASRKLRACAGVAARLSRPLVIAADVMLRIG